MWHTAWTMGAMKVYQCNLPSKEDLPFSCKECCKLKDSIWWPFRTCLTFGAKSITGLGADTRACSLLFNRSLTLSSSLWGTQLAGQDCPICLMAGYSPCSVSLFPPFLLQLSVTYCILKNFPVQFCLYYL